MGCTWALLINHCGSFSGGVSLAILANVNLFWHLSPDPTAACATYPVAIRWFVLGGVPMPAFRALPFYGVTVGKV